jgi:very-short-patch-repair endonuclease
MTDAERHLWRHLCRRQVADAKFRRQACIGRYIVDFVYFEKKLVIELDGGQHTEQVEYDEQRTSWLNSQGFRVLRFWNHEVFEDVDSVLEVIWDTLMTRHAGE